MHRRGYHSDAELGCELDFVRALRAADRDAVAAAIDRIRETLRGYGARPERFGPIHADLTPENVLRTADGLVLIDFDDFAAGWHLFDLATALYFYTPHPRADDYRAALFAGYESLRPLDADDRAAFPAILLARGLTYLGWAADRRGETTAEWHASTVLPHVVSLARDLLAAAEGVWFTEANGDRYLDAYNNVPHVGHGNPRVVRALAEQAATLNVHTRYLNERVVDYAERLLVTFDADLDRVLFGNSGSEANELAIRIAQQLTGSTGTHMWGHRYAGLEPDLVTLGKPMGNGHPMSAVVTSAAVLEAFGSTNEFFNTFAGNPVSAAVGEAVLREMAEHDLMARARDLGARARTHLDGLAARHDFLGAAKGAGMFLGLEFTVDGAPAPALAKRAVEAMKRRRVLISRIGRDENVLKVRPPLAFGAAELPILLDALDASLAEI